MPMSAAAGELQKDRLVAEAGWGGVGKGVCPRLPGLPGGGGGLPQHQALSPGPNPQPPFPLPADVTSRGGEPGWRKEPPSGFGNQTSPQERWIQTD